MQKNGCIVNENNLGVYLPLEEVHLGSGRETYLSVIGGHSAGEGEFRKRCPQFDITAG